MKIRELSKNITVYGLGDVAVRDRFFLLGIYVRSFSAATAASSTCWAGSRSRRQIAFRFGLDGSFMRFFYDVGEGRGQRLASTICFFLLALDGAVLVVLLAAAPWLSGVAAWRHRLRQRSAVDADPHVRDRLYVHSVPTLRMEQRTKTFSLLTLVRSVLTIVVRLCS